MEFQLTNLLPSNWMHALGATLFHSLWIGILLAAVTSLIIISTKKSSAALRYNLLTAALCLFVAAMLVTFYQCLNFAGETLKPGVQANQDVLQTGTSPFQNLAPTNALGQFQGFLSLWTSYSTQIVLIWFLIICAKSIQLMAGLHTVFYLKRTNVFDAGTFWEEKVSKLAANLGIRQSVKLLQSGLAKVPMAAGHFKPVILLPLGMLNGLSMAEVEAILSHELAHIKRRDYLVNILQSAIEIIFFFNPAVLWLSKLIREERENCCDDLALTCTGSKHDYIKALISCEEFQNNVPTYAMALTGNKNQLLGRVSRMVFNKTSSLNKVEKTILTVALISSLILSAAFRKKENPTHPVASPHTVQRKNMVNFQQDTTKQSHHTIVKKQVKEKLKATARKKEIAANQSKLDMENVRYNKEVERYNREMARYNQLAAKNSAKYAADAQRYTRELSNYAKEQQKYNRKATSVPPAPPSPPTILPPPAPPTPPSYPSAPAAPAPPKPAVNVNTSSNHNKNQSLSEQVIAAMMKDGLITQTKNLTYELSKDEFVVNTVAQPEAVLKKYVNLFLRDKPNTRIRTAISTN